MFILWSSKKSRVKDFNSSSVSATRWKTYMLLSEIALSLSKVVIGFHIFGTSYQLEK